MSFVQASAAGGVWLMAGLNRIGLPTPRNVAVVFAQVHAAYPLMLRQGFGHIVNTASMQGLVPSPLTASCAATGPGPCAARPLHALSIGQNA